MRVSIGGPDWAEIRPVELLTRLDRKTVNAVITYEIDARTGRAVVNASMDDDIADALLPLVCTDWSLPYPPPAIEAKSLDLLSLAQDNALRAAIQPHVEAIRGDGAPIPENEVPTAAFVS